MESAQWHPSFASIRLRIFEFSPVGFKGNLSLLDILFFPGVLTKWKLEKMFLLEGKPVHLHTSLFAGSVSRIPQSYSWAFGVDGPGYTLKINQQKGCSMFSEGKPFFFFLKVAWRVEAG